MSGPDEPQLRFSVFDFFDVDENFPPNLFVGLVVALDSDELVNGQRVEELVAEEDREAIARNFRQVVMPFHGWAEFRVDWNKEKVYSFIDYNSTKYYLNVKFQITKQDLNENCFQI